jgi:hypothetical protein
MPAEDHEEFDDEIEVFEESLFEALTAEKLSQFREHEFFKDFNDSSIRKFISLYLDFNAGNDVDPTPEDVYNFMTEEGLGLFALDNIEALRSNTFKKLAKKDPKFIEACRKYYPDAFEDEESDHEDSLDYIFKEVSPEKLQDVKSDVKKIYFELTESNNKVPGHNCVEYKGYYIIFGVDKVDGCRIKDKNGNFVGNIFSTENDAKEFINTDLEESLTEKLNMRTVKKLFNDYIGGWNNYIKSDISFPEVMLDMSVGLPNPRYRNIEY